MVLKNNPVKLTNTQYKILAVINLYGGKFRSLNRLAREVNINYSWAWSLVARLESEGHITITRAGRDLIMTTSHRAKTL